LPAAPVVSVVRPVLVVLLVAVRARGGPRAVSVLVGPAARVARVVRVLTVRRGSIRRVHQAFPVVLGDRVARAVLPEPAVCGVMAARAVPAASVAAVAQPD